MDEPQAPLTEREQFEAWIADVRRDGLSDQSYDWALLGWMARAAISTAPVQGVPLTGDLIGRVLGAVARVVTDEQIQAMYEDGEWKSRCIGPNEYRRIIRHALAALASAPHPTTPSNTLGDALTGPGDPVASLPTPPIATGRLRSALANLLAVFYDMHTETGTMPSDETIDGATAEAEAALAEEAGAKAMRQSDGGVTETDYTDEQVAAMNEALHEGAKYSEVLQSLQSCLQDFEPPHLALACEILHRELLLAHPGGVPTSEASRDL